MNRTDTAWKLVRTIPSVVRFVTTLLHRSVPAEAADQAVTPCGDDAQFSSLLASGGTMTFDCGPALIYESNPKVITVDPVVDGGARSCSAATTRISCLRSTLESRSHCATLC